MRQALSALFIATGLLGFGAAHAGPVQWNTGVNANGHYYEFIAGGFTWDGALADAATRSHLGQTGYLATVVNAEENNFVASVATVPIFGPQQAWLSGSDDGSEGNWTWRAGPEAGQAFTYNNWGAGVPDNAWGGQNFLVTNFMGTGGWDDGGDKGTNWSIGYVVEYGGNINGVPEPTSLALALAGLVAAGSVRRRAR